MPTGNQLRAARSLIGLKQWQLAEAAGIHPGVMNRMEKAGRGRVKGIKNLKAVMEALGDLGVEITETGVQLMPKKPKR